ncbi:MAG: crossover junction endodeoxyribonuclease RuvC [Anaerolineae bacterium]|nr:crossover junction endodeoxyribonuclease RuvC [Anaerolineae bacterium]
MRVLGIDPGTATTGYAVVEEVEGRLQLVTLGVITTPAKTPLPSRLQEIYRSLDELIKLHEPDSAAVEELFFSRNARTAMSVGHARGVTLLALADADLPIAEYTPMQIKQAVTGYGNAGKQQVQEMVRMLLNLSDVPRPDDAADAAAVAICYLHRSKLDGLLNA